MGTVLGAAFETVSGPQSISRAATWRILCQAVSGPTGDQSPKGLVEATIRFVSGKRYYYCSSHTLVVILF